MPRKLYKSCQHYNFRQGHCRIRSFAKSKEQLDRLGKSRRLNPPSAHILPPPQPATDTTRTTDMTVATQDIMQSA